KGYAAPAAGETLARARALAEQLDRSDCLGPLLYGQWLFHVNRLELKLALSFAERLERIGEAHDDDGLLLLGHLVHGISRIISGISLPLASYLNGVIDCMIRPTALSTQKSRWQTRTTKCSNFFGSTLTWLGYIDQGRARLNQALKDARQHGHLYTLA